MAKTHSSKSLSIRLFVNHKLDEACEIACDRAQANYLINVLRLNDGAEIALFNGKDGEWAASVQRGGKRAARLVVERLLRAQTIGPELHYLFAPLKRARLDYMVQKAVELGVSRFTPVITEYTQRPKVNLERMQANAVEAAEQCGILSLPLIDEPVNFFDFLAAWDEEKALIFCDEALGDSDGDDEGKGPVEMLGGLKGKNPAVLIGPEGGFSSDERLLLREKRFVTSLSLGPRIMRADTAAVAALSLVNAVTGDWL